MNYDAPAWQVYCDMKEPVSTTPHAFPTSPLALFNLVSSLCFFCIQLFHFVLTFIYSLSISRTEG